MNIPKKIYVIDRNGRMHLIEITPDLTINGVSIDTAETAENILEQYFADRCDIKFKSSNYLKVFDANNLIGFQIVPVHE
jgi:hypothetical protein